MSIYLQKKALAQQGDVDAQAWLTRRKASKLRWRLVNPDKVRLYEERYRRAKGFRSMAEWRAEQQANKMSDAERIAKHKAYGLAYRRERGARPMAEWRAQQRANKMTVAERRAKATEYSVAYRRAKGSLPREEYFLELKKGKTVESDRLFRLPSTARVAACRARKPISEYKQMQALAKEGDPKAIAYIEAKNARQRAYKQKVKAQRLVAA